MMLTIVVLLSLFHTSLSSDIVPDTYGLCDGCSYDNGVGLVADPDDCFNYFQCLQNRYSYIVMRCAPGTYFNASLLTCDFCTNETYVGNLACNCSLNEDPMNVTDSSVFVPCDLRSHPSDDSKFEQYDNGNWVEMPCAPGTSFDQANCICGANQGDQGSCAGCVESPWGSCFKPLNCSSYRLCALGGAINSIMHCPANLYFDIDAFYCNAASLVDCDPSQFTGTIPDTVCNEEVYLPFINGPRDEKYNVRVESEYVTYSSSDEFALFYPNSFIRIVRFSNTDFRETLKITFQVVLGADYAPDQAIVTNSDCGKPGTVYIIQQSTAVMNFTVMNSTGDAHTLLVDSSAVQNYEYGYVSPPSDWVTLDIRDGIMTATVGSETESMNFYGSIGRSQCALYLGKEGGGLAGFYGDLDEFKLYMC